MKYRIKPLDIVRPTKLSMLLLLALVFCGAILGFIASSGPTKSAIESVDKPPVTECAVFAGGCFWGLQAAFDELPGVVHTRAGYVGGLLANPSYEQVVSGETGHAEAVEVTFDPGQISYERLVRYFFAHHRYESNESDSKYQTRPYRSEIFVQNASQRAVAEKLRLEMSSQTTAGKHVTTLISDAGRFWEAEAYHQKYLSRCGR